MSDHHDDEEAVADEAPAYSTTPDGVAEHIAREVRDAARASREGLAAEAEQAAAQVKAAATEAGDAVQARALEAAAGLSGHMSMLSGEMVALAQEIKGLRGQTIRQRRLIRLMAVSLVLDVCLSLGLGALFLKANSSDEKTRASCLAGNETRASQVTLWDHVIGELRGPSPTPERAHQLDDFRTFVLTTFEPRVCPTVSELDLRWLAVVPFAGVTGAAALVTVRRRRAQKAMAEMTEAPPG